MEVSVIITALDEPYVNKTIDDIIEKSDSRLKEIIVIDDNSSEPISHKEARVIRNKNSKGLIWGRNYGSDLAKSEIVVSIDPHVKVDEDWLSPIVKRLEEKNNCLVAPKTKCLDPEKWEDIKGKSSGIKTAFNTKLDFNWVTTPGAETPVVAGHCFGFTKSWWEDSGRFDCGMKVWGGENIEFALRTWLCGGSVEIVDSWVSHWFKPAFQYTVTSKTLTRNKARVVEVWFDDFKHVFYNAIRVKRGLIDVGDIRQRLRIKARKQERPFEWFLNRFDSELKLIKQ